MGQLKPKAASKPTKLERFIRIVEMPLKPGDMYQSYQPEIVIIDGDRVVQRRLVDKPNLFEYAFTQAGELIDPRNEVEISAS